MINSITRRDLLLAGGGNLALLGAACGQATPLAALPPPASTSESLARLKEGNERFVSGKMRHAHESAEWRKYLVTGQQPFATILGCADSRVPPELIFDQGFGDLFIVRVAGNVIAPDVSGSLAYAVVHLKTMLIVVLGHEGCGAVTAAIDVLAGRAHENPGILNLLDLIKPGLKDLPAGAAREKQISAGVEANVRWSIRQLLTNVKVRDAVDKKLLMIVGAVYELESGRVRFLNL